MADSIPRSPSFISIACTANSSSVTDSDDTPITPKVRFDQDCVLIPDPVPSSRLPRLVTKSYSLPLWKRKHRDPPVVSDSEEDLNDDHVVFKVSVPSLTIKPRSPSRGDAAQHPLVPCLINSPDAATGSALSQSPPRANRPRRASVPPPMQPDTVILPLRACCSQCYPSIDRCMKEGDHWQVHFSKGAARRRKSVSDTHTHSSRPSHRCVRDAMPGFDAIVAVDEVDRRRRQSKDKDALTAFTLEMSSVPADPVAAENLPLRRALSLPDEGYPNRAPLVHNALPRPRSPPIPEEDEQRASPRRTPVTSPGASSTNLPTTQSAHIAQASHVQSFASDSPTADDVTTDAPEKAALKTPLPASPSIPFGKDPSTSYFSVAYQSSPLYEHSSSFSGSESPLSSPSSSPRIEHTRPIGIGSPRKRSMMDSIPGPATIFRASTQVLKGMSGMAGVPMSA
ncbi:hypothetical protein PYCCODRAFT_1405602 [Trametes coccinea BRFM310]|uniref:Uncharacterized protein n=1 Tax=Trametes coccinea (strain BRFM310) TaxID=1353009 RepID=A0A1Y2IZW1_TRAC3|nr:hypothetical protein PYCCODRAFT_1405602 [Trametes coccinea BRFM310]